MKRTRVRRGGRGGEGRRRERSAKAQTTAPKMQNAPFCLGDVGQPRMHFRSRLGQPVHLQHFSHQNICSILSLKVGGKMDGSGNSKPAPEVLELQPIEATPASFEEYGQVIEASPDGDEFGPQDAQLDLSRGVPR